MPDEASRPWIPMQLATPVDSPDTAAMNALDPCNCIMLNDRYQVAVYVRGEHPVFGDVAHLSIKRRDRLPIHDWRDLQRIKNDICGEECEAIELYPAESRLVDSANQYHLFVFRTYHVDLGFEERLVSDGTLDKSRQRPWPREDRPPDCLNAHQLESLSRKTLERAKLRAWARRAIEEVRQLDPALAARLAASMP